MHAIGIMHALALRCSVYCQPMHDAQLMPMGCASSQHSYILVCQDLSGRHAFDTSVVSEPKRVQTIQVLTQFRCLKQQNCESGAAVLGNVCFMH